MNSVNKRINRKPVVSGRFYPSNAKELKNTLATFFSKFTSAHYSHAIRAVISPHAGYIFSGQVAAEAFARINPNTNYQNIFVLAPSHHLSFNGASIYNAGNYETPLGEIELNYEIADALIEKSPLFNYYPEAHSHEHSLEVQLPFLQYWLKKPFKLVPVVIGTQDEDSLEEIAMQLSSYFNSDNLFVISSDFSHFPNFDDAVKADMRMSQAILSKNVQHTRAAIEANKKENIKNLATSACGISGIICLLHIMKAHANLTIEQVKYLNSGHSKYGDTKRVVGYLSFIVNENPGNPSGFKLSDDEKNTLLTLARNALTNKLNGTGSKPSYQGNAGNLHEKCGVFVSLHNGDKLRGCIGRFTTDNPLHILVQKMAIAAALSDSRFPHVEAHELEDISIEISVLSPMKKITSINEISIGTHGIYIKKGFHKGTLLPQVAVAQNWTPLEFLNYCSEHKAGIGKNGWKNANVFTYTAEVFSE